MKSPFRTIALIGKYKSLDIAEPLLKLADFLASQGLNVVVDNLTGEHLARHPYSELALEDMGGKVDLVIDSLGGALFNQLVSMLGYGGRISVVGRSAGVVPDFNTATLLFRRIRIGGIAASDYTPEAAQAVWTEIVGRLAAIKKRPVVDSIFSFDDVKAAFARLHEGPMGKVIVRIQRSEI